MDHDLFIIAPSDLSADALIKKLAQLFETADVSAMLLPKGTRNDYDYIDYVKAVGPTIQDTGCALILDNAPSIVKSVKADGVQIDGSFEDLKEAMQILRPDYIIGVGNLSSRHDAMVKGELDVDYVLFGDVEMSEHSAYETANWWAETFEIPSIYLTKDAKDQDFSNLKSEFIGFTAEVVEDTSILTDLFN